MALNRTREAFVSLHEHEFLGHLCDAVATRRAGGELALWLTNMKVKIRDRLGKAYDDLLPPELKPK